MDLSEIVFTLEFADDGANETANEYLKKGWLLISVGQKFIGTIDSGQAYYNMAYVVGATKDQYLAYQNDQNSINLL